MDRTEWGITVLGLLATFLLPWPLASGGADPDADAPQRVVAVPRADAQRMFALGAFGDSAVAAVTPDQPAR